MEPVQAVVEPADWLRAGQRRSAEASVLTIIEAAGLAQVIHLPIGQPAERPLQDTRERDRVMRIVQYTEHIDQIDHFLAAVEMFSPSMT